MQKVLSTEVNARSKLLTSQAGQMSKIQASQNTQQEVYIRYLHTALICSWSKTSSKLFRKSSRVSVLTKYSQNTIYQITGTVGFTVFLNNNNCMIRSLFLFHHHHHHLSLNREGRWGTTNDIATGFLHFSLFSTALWNLPNSRPVHSLMLSSHLFLCLPCLLPSFRCALQDGSG